MTAAEILQQSIALHQAGQLPEALALYQQVLEAAPENADALHLAGLVQHQLGEHQAAADLISQALELRSESALYLSNYAAVLNSLARFAEAGTAAKKATARNPESGAAWHCLGVAQLGQGDFVAAEKTLQRAIAKDPAKPEYFNNLGMVYRNLRQTNLAVSSFSQAVTLDPGYREARLNLAAVLLSSGALSEAGKICRESIRQDPADAGSYLILGRVMMIRTDYGEAITLLEKYLELRPDDVQGYIALAGALNITGAYSDAAATLEKAAILDPESAEIMQMQGGLDLQLGDQTSAKAKLQEAIRRDPDISNAYFELSQLPGVTLSSPHQKHLAEMITRDDLSAAPKSTAAFTLAHCAEKAEDFSAAFSYLTAANEMRLSLLESFGYIFDAGQLATEFQSYRKFFTTDFFERNKDRGHPSEVPVFVIGLPRTGKTLVTERILASHAEAEGAGELLEIEKIIHELKHNQEPYPNCLTGLAPMEIHEIAEGYLTRLQSFNGSATRVVNENPFNFIHLGLITYLFPKAKIIHCRRDLRDVGYSCYSQKFSDPLPWANDLRSIGLYLNQYENLMAHWEKYLPTPIFTLDYEDLVVDFSHHAKRIIDYIGLACDENYLALHEIADDVQTASSAQVREPISQQFVGRWRNYEEQLKPLIDILENQAD